MPMTAFTDTADWTKTGRADPHTVSYFRELLGLWLDDAVAIDPQQHADIVLAVDEALANCAEHAYRGTAPGVMTLRVGHDVREATISVCVTDRGAWLDSTPAQAGRRGRGMDLMRARADHCTIEGSARGTTVCLRFDRCPAPRPD
jgi:serine/threonine-protein kinase RsbW